MRKLTLFIILVISLLFVNSVLAAELKIEKTDKGSVIIRQLNNPAIFEFNITNPGNEEISEIYTLVSVTMFPKEEFLLPEGQSLLEIQAVPNEDFRDRSTGLINFEYQIKGEKTGIFKDKLLVKMVDLEDVFDFELSPVSPEDSSTTVKIKNLEKAHIPEIKIMFDSVFFEHEESFALEPLEEKTITITLNKQPDEKLAAGQYLVTITIPHSTEGETKYTKPINFLEKKDISTSQDISGFIIRETTSTKTNTGNVPTLATIEITKGIIGRFFTTTSPTPDNIERSDFSVTYTWEKSLAPTESLVATTTTNYTIPFIILIVIILVALLVYFYTRRALSITKTVSLIRTKGGEFALKVNLRVKTNKHIDNVQLTDSLPGMTKLFDKFGKKPDKIDHTNRRLTWNLGDLDKGEVRVLSYIIFSKINIVGRFELPAALATFQREGMTREAWSNRAFFAKEESE